MGGRVGIAAVVCLLAGGCASAGHGPTGHRASTGPDGTQPGVMLNVRAYGAAGDGKTMDTAAIQAAIDRCWVFGGGTVEVPAGSYLTGALQLRSHVTLRLDSGATLAGSADMADYPVMQVRWEGKWISGHVGLIYAADAEDVAIVGPGDGTAKIEGNPRVGGRPNGRSPLRHPALIEPIACKGVRLAGFSTSYRSMWSIHPTLCSDVTATKLVIRSTGGNGDGIDVDSCRHVRISDCDIETGDDCIAIKSGREEEGYTLAQTTQDVTIENCTLADAIFACIGIGSETSGGIRGVRIEHCTFTHARTYAVYIKTRVGRGAFIEDVTGDDLTASGMGQGFLCINATGSGILGPVPVPGEAGVPQLKDFRFTHVRVTGCPELVRATAITASKPLDGFVLEHVRGTAEKGIALAHMRAVRLEDVEVTGVKGPLVGIYDVTGQGLAGAAQIAAPRQVQVLPAATEAYRLR